jgi:transcriptional regulator with XRE-family HTH domain
MRERESISSQLRRRRLELGLSLSDVARRAGTSVATLSRYESGWTRFETYTLRKLATALDSNMRLRLDPRAGRRKGATARDVDGAVQRLRRLFWDHPLTAADFSRHTTWLTERVLEYGDLADIQALRDALGKAPFLQAVATAERVSPRTRNFWAQILQLEGVSCTKKCSRNTAWNS